MFASAFDVFDAFHSPLHRGFYHRPAKRHRRAHSPYAAHLHPFYHIENLARIALDADTLARTDAFDPEVRETDRGYFITALVPGVAAEDIAVTAARADESSGEADRLLVRSASRPHVRADLRLPPGGAVDADNITASCIDGVFRVVVPKTKTARAEVPVAGGDAPETAPPPGARAFRLDVPGFGARDLRVTVERPARVVEIATRDTAEPSFAKRRFRCDLLENKNAIVSARCADGALTLVVAPPAPPAPVAVPVSAEAPALPAPGPDAAALGEDEITVMRRAVPGRKAAHFEVVAAAGADGVATLRASAGADAGGTRGRVAFAATLPRRLDLRSLKAFVVDGVLTVTAAAPPPAETRTVVVRADAPAALPESESRAPRAETAADAEKAEKAEKAKEPPATEEARAAEKDAVLTETP